MSRTGITYEEVKKAIAELQGRQKNPTVDSIREILGTGSKSTIARFLREWRAQHGLGSDSDGRLPSDLLGIVNGLWDALQNKADTQIEQYRLEFDNKTVQIQQQLTQARQLEATLRQTIHTLEEQLHQQNEGMQLLKAKLMIESQEKIKMTERAASLESRCQENNAENQRLHQLLKHVQKNLEHYQAATQQLRQEQSLTIEKQRNEYEQRISQLQQQITSISAEKLSYQAQYEQTHQAFEKLQSSYAALNQAAQETQTKYHSLSQEHTKLIQQHQDQSHNYELKKQSIIEFPIKLAAYEDKITVLEKNLTKSEDKIQTLRDDFSFVSQEKANLEGQINQLQKLILIKQAEI